MDFKIFKQENWSLSFNVLAFAVGRVVVREGTKHCSVEIYNGIFGV